MRAGLTVVLLSAAALLAGCSVETRDQVKDELVAADKAFSALSLKEGPKAAFLSVIAPDGKLLSDHTRVGPDAVNALFMELPASATLTWEPSFVDVNGSGDLGYTVGRYKLTIPSSSLGGPQLTRTGTYVTIWKRQYGAWKVVLDGGNPDGRG